MWHSAVRALLLAGASLLSLLLFSELAVAQRCCQQGETRKHLVVLLDVSGSMNLKEYAEDAGKPVPTNALDLLTPVRSILQVVIEEGLREGDAFTVIPFGDYPNAPISFEIKGDTDKPPIVGMIGKLRARYDYTDLGLALEQALRHLTTGSYGSDNRNTLVYLVSDGLHNPSPTVGNHYGPVNSARFQDLLARFKARKDERNWAMEVVGINEVADLQQIAARLGAEFTAIQADPQLVRDTLAQRLDRYFGCYLFVDYLPRQPDEVLKLVSGGETWFPLYTLMSKNIGKGTVKIENIELRFLDPGGGGENVIRRWDMESQLNPNSVLTKFYGISTPPSTKSEKQRAVFEVRFSADSRVCPQTVRREFDVSFVQPVAGEERIDAALTPDCARTVEGADGRSLNVALRFVSKYQLSRKFSLDGQALSLKLKGTPRGDLVLSPANRDAVAKWLAENQSFRSNEDLNKSLISARREEVARLIPSFNVDSLTGTDELALKYAIPADLPPDEYLGEISLSGYGDLRVMPSPVTIRVAVGVECGSRRPWLCRQKSSVLVPLGALATLLLVAFFGRASIKWCREEPGMPGAGGLDILQRADAPPPPPVVRSARRKVRWSATLGGSKSDSLRPAQIGCMETVDSRIGRLKAGIFGCRMIVLKPDAFTEKRKGQIIPAGSRFRLSAGPDEFWYEVIRSKVTVKKFILAVVLGAAAVGLAQYLICRIAG